MTEKRFAMVGAGFWAQFQFSAWRELAGARCVAVCDPDIARAQKLASQVEGAQVEGAQVEGAQCYDDLDTMLRQCELDFVDIVTTPETHKSLAETCAGHSIATICQKPLVATLAEARQLVELFEQQKTPLFVHENFRWQSPLREFKSRLDRDEIGSVFRANIQFCNSFPVFDNQPNLAKLDRFILSDLGVHILDVARFLFGEVDSVYCQTARVNPAIQGEDVATVHLKMRSQMAVILEVSYASKTDIESFPQTYLFAEGTKGSLRLTKDYWIRSTTDEGTVSSQHSPRHYDWADPDYDVVHSSIVDCNANMLSSLQKGSPAETDGFDNIKTLELVEACYSSAERNQVLQLPPQ